MSSSVTLPPLLEVGLALDLARGIRFRECIGVGLHEIARRFLGDAVLLEHRGDCGDEIGVELDPLRQLHGAEVVLLRDDGRGGRGLRGVGGFRRIRGRRDSRIRFEWFGGIDIAAAAGATTGEAGATTGVTVEGAGVTTGSGIAVLARARWCVRRENYAVTSSAQKP
jgi:hypothetical protein